MSFKNEKNLAHPKTLLASQYSNHSIFHNKLMCKFNVMCQGKDDHCTCCSQTLIFPQPIRSVLASSTSESVLLQHLFSMVSHQNEVIRTLAEQTASALKKVAFLSKELETSSSLNSAIVPYSEKATSDQILSLLCGSKTSHQFSLSLISQMPNPAYKERGFSLMLEIVDRNQSKVDLTLPVNFKLMVFTAENPPKHIKVNTSGDKVIRGTVEVESNSVVLFKKVVVKEVTSHFRNGSFFLVVMPKNSQEIRPFIIDNFVVKARKFIENEKIKKPKMKENHESSNTKEIILTPSQPKESIENLSENLLNADESPEKNLSGELVYQHFPQEPSINPHCRM